MSKLTAREMADRSAAILIKAIQSDAGVVEIQKLIADMMYNHLGGDAPDLPEND